jgi:hypothetical protein
MSTFYFDESIHDRGEFILGAYVYGPDPDSQVTEAMRRCGLQPDCHEFKSSARMDEHPEQAALRRELRGLLTANYRIGVLVSPSSARLDLGRETLLGLDKIVRANRLASAKPRIFLDQGIFASADDALELADRIGVSQVCEVHPEQDSRQVKGIQLADLVAHTCSTMLLETLGLVTKKAKAGPNSGYDPDLELDLGFELWASIRYQFFSEGPSQPVHRNEDMVVDVAPYGLHIASSCTDSLAKAAMQRFGKCYLGCIH